MDYIAPAGAAAPTDPYIDENPAAGISGSIVPAKYFNMTMGEIVDVITRAGLLPDADALQLADAIIALIAANAGGGGGGGVPTTRLLSTVEGITGGGSLAADRELKLNFPGLTDAGALAMSETIAVHDGSAHKKLTLSALASALAASVVSQDLYAKTVLTTSHAGDYTYTVAPLPAVSVRTFVKFTASAGGTYYVQANIGGAWVTLDSATGTFDPIILERRTVGVVWNGSASKLFKIAGVPRPLGGVGAGGSIEESRFNAGLWVASLAGAGAWNGEIRGFGSGTIDEIYTLAPASLA